MGEELLLVTKMIWLHSIRNKELHISRVCQKLFIASIIACLYSNLDLNHLNQSDIVSLNGLLFTFMSESTFNVMYGFFWEFPGSMAIARRDIADGLYRKWTFYLAKHAAFSPLYLLDVILVTGVTFSTTNLGQGFAGYAYLVAVSFLLGLCSSAYGGALSMAFKNYVNSGLVIDMMNTVLLVISGLYLNVASIPVYLSWTKYLSMFYYGNLLLVSFFWQDVAYISCSLPDQEACLNTGKDVLEAFVISPFNDSGLYLFSGLIGLTLLWHFFGFILFKLRLNQNAD